eukprot:CAMPEP_0118974398 /NCGR_PEP_ID=MMETSP1173-20130426/11287_1 /TAXON_ID=1034831 /ORGANISM="Rhizochromulina marina cf, Strain CCMP1243" /LENGTH=36 /DNA_ID= /DNA_START= /DNA_END= /DNA_ORIENTATION=
MPTVLVMLISLGAPALVGLPHQWFMLDATELLDQWP